MRKGGVTSESLDRGGVLTDWDAKLMRSRIRDLQREQNRIKGEIERTITNLREHCPHEDVTEVRSLMTGTRCNVCGLFNSGKGWNQ